MASSRKQLKTIYKEYTSPALVYNNKARILFVVPVVTVYLYLYKGWCLSPPVGAAGSVVD